MPTALGLLVLCCFVGGCDSEERGEPSCQLAPTIAFEGREYIAVGPRSGLEHTDARVGQRLGAGERATCPGHPEQQVEVYKLVGVPVGKRVFSEPDFGVMKRWNRTGTID